MDTDLTLIGTDTSASLKRVEGLDAAKRYAGHSRSESTWRTYSSSWRAFELYCSTVALACLPASPETVAMFIASEADKGYAVSTLEHRLAAIRLMHLGQGVASPHNTLAVVEVLQGIRRCNKSVASAQKKPVLDDQIKRMVNALDLTTRKGLRDRALLLYGFAGALRRSELVAIDVEHIQAHEKGDILLIPSSKSDQEGRGQKVGVLAVLDSPYCPVSAVKEWRHAARISSGPVFRRFYRNDAISELRLGDRSVALLVKDCAVAIGLRDQEHLFSGHSLRRGFLTSAGQNGAELLKLVSQSRHTRVDTVLNYIDDQERFINHAGESLLGADGIQP